MNKGDHKYHVCFDVDFNYSLDRLRQDLVMLYDPSKTKVMFDICGPGGGNTCVYVHTNSQIDLANIAKYAAPFSPNLRAIEE